MRIIEAERLFHAPIYQAAAEKECSPMFGVYYRKPALYLGISMAAADFSEVETKLALAHLKRLIMKGGLLESLARV